MGFSRGDIVSHKSMFNKFYVIIEDYKNGQFLVEEYDDNFFGVKEKHVFIGKYLLTKSDRRNYVIDDLLNFTSKNE